MDKNQTIRGRNAIFNPGSTTLTPRLREALKVLDPTCRAGSAWDIHRIPGGWTATPDGPYDSVYWNGKKGTWTE